MHWVQRSILKFITQNPSTQVGFEPGKGILGKNTGKIRGYEPGATFSQKWLPVHGDFVGTGSHF